MPTGFHWKTVIGPDCFFEFMVPTKGGEDILNGLLSKRGRVRASLGCGTFAYEGLQRIDNPQVTAWRLSLYEGLVLGGDNPTVRSNIVGVLTGPMWMQERADRAVKDAEAY